VARTQASGGVACRVRGGLYKVTVLTLDLDYDQLAAKLADHMPQGTPWMTVAETAEYVRCSERFLRERLSDIKHSKVDKKVLLHRHDVDEWLKSHERVEW
jgi:excisionase family DNA binding protein